MQENEFIDFMERYAQKHIIRHLDTLSRDDRNTFLNSASGMNFELVFNLHEKFSCQDDTPAKYGRVEPPPVIDADTANGEQKDAVRLTGERAIAEGKTAVVIVAGGQGTRLGYPHPKGMYPISPLKGKSLFQLSSEKILALSRRYGAMIPVLIMTNPETLKDIEDFFTEHDFFGLEADNIFFFSQEMLPSITPDRKLVLKNRTSLLSNPDGHGGSLKALWQSGLTGKLESMGITKIFYCHIDNPLLKIDDPVFLGWHIKENADFSLKVVRKRYPGEKVGNFVMADGKPRMIEYIELPDKIKDMQDGKGNPVFWAGSIGIHFMNTDFIKMINRNGFKLPYHRQVKKIRKEAGAELTEIWKFETFVFDAIPLAGRICCMETIRNEEFAPLKNSDGENSPETVKQAMVAFYKNRLLATGVTVSEGVKVEISPLADLDKITLPSVISEDTYIE